MGSTDTVFVLGGGALDGETLAEVLTAPSIGIDDGFRAWTALGRYPTHYCCVDEDLLEAHHPQISAMVREGRVETALLGTSVLEFDPGLADCPRCVLVDSVRTAPAHSADQAPWSSASCAARYAITLGHRRLRLVGIACGEASELAAMEALRDDVVKQGLDIDIRNCTGASELTRHGVFPYAELEHALGKPLLGAVAVPMTPREEDALTANFKRWNAPECAPFGLEATDSPVPLVIVLNGHPDAALEGRVREAFRQRERLAAAFVGPEFEYCELDKSEDVYIRDYSQPAPPGGYKVGPNAQFFRSMELLRAYGRYVFMMETDCLPIRPGWLAELQRVVEGNDPFWILGSLYRGVGPLNERWRLHVNGNAVYAVGDPRFQAFVEGEWRPALEKLLPTIPTLAYDCVLPLHFTEGRAAPEGRKWELYRDVAHLFRTTDFIQNHAGQAEVERGEGATLEEIRSGSPHTYIVHGRHLFSPLDTEADTGAAPARAHRQVAPLATGNGAPPSGAPIEGIERSVGRVNGGFPEPAPDGAGPGEDQPASLPRVLVLDSTRIGARNATGQLKKNLFSGWPDGGIQQLWMPTWDDVSLARSIGNPSGDVPVKDEAQALEAVEAFDPDVIYYRPTIDYHGRLHGLAEAILTRCPVPLVTHIVDDWPSRLTEEDPQRGAEADGALRAILDRSHCALSVSDRMSSVFSERYGVSFEAVANGIDVVRFREASEAGRQLRAGRDEVVIRYCGGLARDMTFDSVVEVAHASARLSRELAIRFEVYTMPHWRSSFEAAVSDLECVSVLPAVTDSEYPALLAEADLLLLAYNFDADSLRYIRYSMPNKLPEYLGSGVPVVAMGPSEANGIDYLLSRGLGCCITEPDPEALTEALRSLATDPAMRERLAAEGQAFAYEHLDLAKIKTRFERILAAAAEAPPERVPVLAAAAPAPAFANQYETARRPPDRNGEPPARMASPVTSSGHSDDRAAASGEPTTKHAPAPGAAQTPHTAHAVPSPASAAPSRPEASRGGSQGHSAYVRLYLWAKTRQPLFFVAGRAVMWCARKVRRYPFAAASFVTLLGVLTAFGLQGSGSVQTSLLAAAGVMTGVGLLAVVLGFSRFLLKETRHELELQDLALRRRVERTEQLLASESKARRTVEARIDDQRSLEASARAELAGRLDELEADGKDADSKVSALIQAVDQARADIEATGRDLDQVESKVAGLAADQEAMKASLGEKPDREQLIALQNHLDELAAAQARMRTDLNDMITALKTDSQAKERAIELRLSDLAAGHESAWRQVEAELERKADGDAISDLAGRLSRTEASQQAMGRDFERMLAERVAQHAAEVAATADAVAAIEGRLEQVDSRLADRTDRLSFDIVSALRQIHEVWAGADDPERKGLDAEKEHGHVVLMALLAEEARRDAGALRGRTLVEIGTTRERDPYQGSTEKLGIFTGLLGMRFLSVDMDPLNTAAANEVLPYLNPEAMAVTSRGETFLAETSEPLEYVYLDAFDFDHGQHSDERKSRYREILDAEISDEACWQMHELCASALVTRMGKGGLVVIDDTWVDDAGDFAGKGRRAVPLLLASGFSIVRRTPRAVALKRERGPEADGSGNSASAEADG